MNVNNYKLLKIFFTLLYNFYDEWKMTLECKMEILFYLLVLLASLTPYLSSLMTASTSPALLRAAQ